MSDVIELAPRRAALQVAEVIRDLETVVGRLKRGETEIRPQAFILLIHEPGRTAGTEVTWGGLTTANALELGEYILRALATAVRAAGT